MTHPLPITELLNESGWLRALAASLMGDGAQADDLVQDTWLAALRRPPHAEGEPRPWLARVVRNLARNTRRERCRRRTREAFTHEERTLPGPDALAQEAEAQRLLAEAVTRLAEPLRDVIVLRYFHGRDSNAAAARLGVPAGTVRTRLARALEALRADLDRSCKGGREGWALLFSPLVGRAGVEASVAAAGTVAAVPATGAATLAAWGVGLGLLATVATIGWRALSGSGEAERLVPEVALASAGSDVRSEPASPGAREAVAPLPASSTQASAVSAGAKPEAPRVASNESELSGVIRVDGRAPEWPIELILEPELPSVEPGDVQPRRRMRGGPLTLPPEEQGRFAVQLSEGWKGKLTVEGYAFASGEPHLSIDAPRSGLLVELSSGPEIVGRILGPEGRALAGLEGRGRHEHGRAGQLLSEETRPFRTRADGRFRIPIRASSEVSESVTLELRVESEAHGFLQYTSSPLAPSVSHYLGDLRLEPVRRLELLVHDPRGIPIEGARALVEPLGLAGLSAGTSADGSGRLAFAPERDAEVRVCASGYLDRVLRAPLTGRLEVVLEPLATLDVYLSVALRAEAVHLRLSSAQAAFVWDESGWGPATLQAALGAVCPNVRQPGGAGASWEYRFQRQHDGHYRLAGLLPNVPFTLEVLGRDLSVLATETVSVAPAARAKLQLGEPDPGETAREGSPKRRSAALR